MVPAQITFYRSVIFKFAIGFTLVSWLATDRKFPFHQVLSYKRWAIYEGEWWRVLTCHFVHANLSHLILNAVALLLTLLIFRDHVRTRNILFSFFFVALSLGILFFFILTNMNWYFGLSGVIHGIFLFYLILSLKTGPSLLNLVALLFISIKLLAEQRMGALDTIGDLIGMNVVVDAHLYGALSGIMATVLIPRVERMLTPHPLSTDAKQLNVF